MTRRYGCSGGAELPNREDSQERPVRRRQVLSVALVLLGMQGQQCGKSSNNFNITGDRND